MPCADSSLVIAFRMPIDQPSAVFPESLPAAMIRVCGAASTKPPRGFALPWGVLGGRNHHRDYYCLCNVCDCYHNYDDCFSSSSYYYSYHYYYYVDYDDDYD